MQVSAHFMVMAASYLVYHFATFGYRNNACCSFLPVSSTDVFLPY